MLLASGQQTPFRTGILRKTSSHCFCNLILNEAVNKYCHCTREKRNPIPRVKITDTSSSTSNQSPLRVRMRSSMYRRRPSNKEKRSFGRPLSSSFKVVEGREIFTIELECEVENRVGDRVWLWKKRVKNFVTVLCSHVVKDKD